MKNKKLSFFKKIFLILALCGMINPCFANTVSPSHHNGNSAHSHGNHSPAHSAKNSKSVGSHKATHASKTNTKVNKSTKNKQTKSVKTTKQKTTKLQAHHKPITTQKHTKASGKKSKAVTNHKSKTSKHSKGKTHPAAAPNQSLPATNNMDNLINASSATGKRIVTYVDNFMSSLRYTTYRSGDRIFDTMHGIFELDCSHYVDHILQNACPNAYHSLVSSTGSTSPDSQNYFDFFNRLSTHMKNDWNAVDDAKQLQAGDVLVFRYLNASGYSSSGHVMMVMGKPVIKNDNLFVRVSDSAEASHSNDTRAGHSSGVGIGTMVLKVNPTTGRPTAYAWDVDSRWQNRVEFAMARPVEIG